MSDHEDPFLHKRSYVYYRKMEANFGRDRGNEDFATVRIGLEGTTGEQSNYMITYKSGKTINFLGSNHHPDTRVMEKPYEDRHISRPYSHAEIATLAQRR